MKKILPCVLFVLALFSCKNDDEITVPACSEATNVQSQSIGIDQAVISWSDSNTDATFTVEYGPTGFVPGNGTLRDTNTNEVSLSGLDGNTTYDLYVQSNCSFDNISSQTPAFSFTTLPELVVPQFSTNLSDMNIYVGDLDELNPSPYVFEYNLATSLFTDYGLKQRLLALPPGEKMNFVDADLPNFPDNTVITKTFYYNFDENDPAAGRQIIETRVIIKMNGEWELGTYHWNAEQTDAVLNPESVTVPISYSNQEGETVNINYIIPGAADCFTCHNINGAESPIGPKMRTMNF
ncbi:MAG: hypothetical protein HKO96_07125, partial [Flavobacteriaceae bacterium]|nr:hypothetical protein [Flavobacteriaceae bacterium]